MSELKFWSPTWGLGRLDFKPKRAVFAPDSGAPSLAIEWVQSRTGQADKKSIPRRKADRDEWWNWLTLTSRAGEVFSFRRGGAPPAASKAAQ